MEQINQGITEFDCPNAQDDWATSCPEAGSDAAPTKQPSNDSSGTEAIGKPTPYLFGMKLCTLLHSSLICRFPMRAWSLSVFGCLLFTTVSVTWPCSFIYPEKVHM